MIQSENSSRMEAERFLVMVRTFIASSGVREPVPQAGAISV